MTCLHGRALEDEFLSTARELAGDVESRGAGDRYLLTTHALYHGGPVSWAMTPKIFDVAQIEILRDAAETMGRIMDKITAEYLRNPEFRKLFHFSPELEELTLIPTGYEQMIPIARVDVFFNEETGDYQFCELNTDGSAGMTSTVEVTRHPGHPDLPQVCREAPQHHDVRRRGRGYRRHSRDVRELGKCRPLWQQR
jgi:hypothetical protein